MDERRYVFDALYGPVYYPEYLWKVSLCPEFQRLREVRLCNINSLCLTGGANINRYEHSLGAAYLALQCIQAWPSQLSDAEARRIVLAALLHDIGSTAFGHSVQYVIDREGFEHQSFLDIVHGPNTSKSHYTYQFALTEPIYFGMPKRLSAMLDSADLEAINDMVEGKGPFGPLISGTMDLDNIDNVYRLAYHIGLVKPGEVPLELARHLRVSDGALLLADDADALVTDWYETRRRLYEFLLLNPDEFSAKCMLQEALELAQAQKKELFRWHDVDFELLTKLAEASDETRGVISRLVIGDLYGCIAIYVSAKTSLAGNLENPVYRGQLEKAIADRLRLSGTRSFKNALVAVHVIKDINKTQRQIVIQTCSGRSITVGRPTRRLLIGVFLKNVGFSMVQLKPSTVAVAGVDQLVAEVLKTELGDPDLAQLELYAEASQQR